MKIDLHVHSKFSMRPSEWILKKLDCPESFTEPLDLYRIAKNSGMDLVTITDHNCIDGCLEIAHLNDCFISEEVTTYFPEDRCKLHVTVYNITEAQHQDIQDARENVFELTSYLNEQDIFHSLAHPLYSVNGKLKIEHVEKCILLFRYFEINGARSDQQNQVLHFVLQRLTPEVVDQLSEKHNLKPVHDFPWQKGFTGGSDDHSSLSIGSRYTVVPQTQNLAAFFQGLKSFKGQVEGQASSPQSLARNVYSIAYQYYAKKLQLEKYAGGDLLFEFLERFLRMQKPPSDEGMLTKIHFLWKPKRKSRTSNGHNDVVLNLLRQEAHRFIKHDRDLSKILAKPHQAQEQASVTKEWFRFVNTVSNRLLFHFVDHIVESLAGAHFLNLFQSIGSAAALYSISAPYFLSYSIFSKERHFANAVRGRFSSTDTHDDIKVAHFTDTFYEINGVSRTLRQQIDAARRSLKNYVVITCDARETAPTYGIQNFTPIGEYELTLYPEQKLSYPPFLEILDFCYERGVTHVHAATPGPVGLAALGVGHILNVPTVATYHTDLPQYAKYLTDDEFIADLVWKYIVWFYQRVDLVLVPSHASAVELAEKGISEDKIQIYPRGVDVNLFHPSKSRDVIPGILQPSAFRLLYVGRISKEKDLDVLVEAFKALSKKHSDVQLLVVGDGPYKQEMAQELADYNCCFTGYLNGDDLASLYASCDAFVFPSTTDTFGNVVLEAQASGLPVILTDKGGPCENIIPNETGLVVEGRNPRALAAAMKDLYLNRERTKNMGQSARIYMESRDFQSAFEKAWALYSMVGNGNGNGAVHFAASSAGMRHYSAPAWAMPSW